MTRRRRNHAAPVSLFAFQDIVTSITGIILLIAMAMAIQVARAPARERAGIDAVEYGVLAKTLDSLNEQLEAKRAAVSANALVMEQTATVGPSGSEADLEQLRVEIDRLEARIDAQRAQIVAERSRESAAQAELAALEESIGAEETDRRMAEAEARIARLRNTNRILFNEPPDSGGPLILAELFRNRMLIATAGASEEPVVFDGPDYSEDAIRAIGRYPRNAHWVLFAHPGSTKPLNRLRAELQEAGRSVGFDLLPDDVTVLDPITGAK